MRRKIVQLAVGGSGRRSDGIMAAALCALADDGSAWTLTIDAEGLRWDQMPGLPPAHDEPGAS